MVSTGCGNKNDADEEVTKEKSEKIDESAEKETETLVTIEEPPYEIAMLEPDSIGNRYMEATLSLIRNL